MPKTTQRDKEWDNGDIAPACGHRDLRIIDGRCRDCHRVKVQEGTRHLETVELLKKANPGVARRLQNTLRKVEKTVPAAPAGHGDSVG